MGWRVSESFGWCTKEMLDSCVKYVEWVAAHKTGFSTACLKLTAVISGACNVLNLPALAQDKHNGSVTSALPLSVAPSLGHVFWLFSCRCRWMIKLIKCRHLRWLFSISIHTSVGLNSAILFRSHQAKGMPLVQPRVSTAKS